LADAGAKVLRGLLDVFILESLERGPKHGYGLLREMADAFGTEPNRNRLYPLLGRMVQDGLIAERSEPSGSRTLYALTDAGREALAGYRRLPASFHERIARVWSVARESPGLVPASGDDAPVFPALSRAVPVSAAPAQGFPYPCPDARVSVERAPRSGDLSIRLTGCPMGAYEYCALCPVSKSVEGLRKLTFL
jgi:DNA-binding PadR family transcriptional regulator